MNRNRLAALILGAVLTALAAGCGNTNTNTANTNNSNTAVVNGNTNNANNANVNTNANRGVTREEYERNKERYQREAKGSGSKVGQGADDLWLWAKTRADLLAARDLTSTGINVDVNNGVITLRGTVPDAAQRAQAEQVAKGVTDNKGVKNQLTVSATGANANNRNANANKGANTKRP